jgi:hypothetical protein
LIWENLGLICDARSLPFGSNIYCQSPHAIDFGTFIRVFFTTRENDGERLYKSFPAYVDFSTDFEEILSFGPYPLMNLGELGSFDEHGIFPIQPFRDKNGNLLASTTGWSRRVSTPTDSSIGLVKSENEGQSFTRVGIGPILAPLHNDPFLIADGIIFYDSDEYHMFYISGERWIDGPENKERVYKIRHATSKDLQNWNRDYKNVIADSLGLDECQALPSVIRTEDGWLMAFCFREAIGFRTDSSRGYRIGWAKSQDLHEWERIDDTHSISSHQSNWDSDMQAYPNLFRNQNGTFLLYNGNYFGRDGFGVAKLQPN